MSQADPVNEGLIHAWLDGQLPPEDAARIEHLVATDDEWGAAAAEARGLVAAASRVLGALDDVPRVGHAKTGRREDENAGERRDTRELRAWWRAPWMRAAAGIVLVAGVSGVVWMGMDQRSARESVELRQAPAADTARRQEVLSVSGRGAESTTKSLSAPAPSARAQGARPAPREADANVAQRQLAKAASVEELRVSVDTLGRRDAVAGAAVATKVVAAVPPPVSTPPVVEQGVVGATSAAVAQDRAANTLALAAKVLDSSVVDARLAGCWAPIVVTREGADLRERRAEAPPTAPVLWRFAGGVATDVVTSAVASPPPAQRAAGAAQAAAPPPSAMADAATTRTVINATVTRAPQRDSSFVAEWIDQNIRRIATFVARGDTLRGTVRTVPGDTTRAAEAFLAARVICPR